MIHEQVEAEMRLISDLLDLTRALQGKLSTILTPCSVHAIIRKAVENERRRLDAGARTMSELSLGGGTMLSPASAISSSSLPDSLGHLKLVTHLDAVEDVCNVDPVRMNQVCMRARFSFLLLIICG